MINVDFTASHFNTANFPARANWLVDVTYVATTHKNYTGGGPAERTVMVSELHYTVLGVGNVSRVRRCYVVQSYADNNAPSLKPILLCAFPASSSLAGASGGAQDMWNYTQGPSTSNIQFDWPLEVVRDTGCFAVLIDPPGYGYNSYTPTNAYDGMIDHICGIDAALWFIGFPVLQWYPTLKTYQQTKPLMRVSPKLLLGGLSYGAITTSFMTGLLPDAYASYMSGAYPVKATEAFGSPAYPPQFYPADWTASGYDYTDMLKASSIQHCMISYGWDNGGVVGALPSDYARTNPNWTEALIDTACNGLVTYDPTRFEYRVKTTAPVVQGHEIDLPHIRSWMSARVNEINNTL